MKRIQTKKYLVSSSLQIILHIHSSSLLSSLVSPSYGRIYSWWSARISDIGFSLEWYTTRGRITNWGRTDEGVHIREKPMTTQGRIMKYQTDVTIGSLIQYPSKNEGYLPNNLIPYRYIGLVFHYSYVSWIRLLHSLSGSYQHISIPFHFIQFHSLLILHEATVATALVDPVDVAFKKRLALP
jgi:hypothetical protein